MVLRMIENNIIPSQLSSAAIGGHNKGLPLGGESVLYRELHERPAWVLSIIGAGGSGKSTKMFWIIDNWFPDDHVFLWNHPSDVIRKFPPELRKRSHSFEDFIEIAGRSGLIVLDDSALHLLSRSAGDGVNKQFLQILTVARHNDWRIIITVQNSILNDKGVYEVLDGFSLRCRMTALQTATERDEFRDYQVMVNEYIEHLASSYREFVQYAFCYETMELFRFPNWKHMTEEISKPYRGFVPSKKKKEGD